MEIMKQKIIEILKEELSKQGWYQDHLISHQKILSNIANQLMEQFVSPPLSLKEIDIMAEEYSKETLGAGYRKDKLPATSLEVGYVDGFRDGYNSKVSFQLQPINESEIADLQQEFLLKFTTWKVDEYEDTSIMNEHTRPIDILKWFKAVFKELTKKE